MSSIITAAELDTYTGKTLTPAIAEQVVKAINAYIERSTGRLWGDTETVTETYDYKPTIWLRRQDVVNVSKIQFGYYGSTAYQTLNTTAYYWDRLGRLNFFHNAYTIYPSNYRLSVKVTYTYGVDEVPEDLKFAALGIASGFYNWATNEQREVSAVEVGSYRVEYAGNRRAQDVIDTTSQANFAVLSSYKAPRV